MDQSATNPTINPPTPLPDWGREVRPGYCVNCNWRFLASGDKLPENCPHCFQANLEPFSLDETTPLASMMHPPELYTPFGLTAQQVNQILAQVPSGLPFAPEDLKVENLNKRLQWLWLPVWLIDASVTATWEAEVGFNYQVKSHQEKYGDYAGWQTQEVLETRQNWEPRLGHMDRVYHNVTAQALEAYRGWVQALGTFQFENALPYDATTVLRTDSEKNSVVCLPDRSQKDAWPEALPTFQALASGECRQACGADQIREFRWKPEFFNPNWSLLLLPVLTSYYNDDDQKPQQILIHGQTGKMTSVRKASMRKAQAASLTILMAALLLFGFSMCLGAFAAISPALLPVAGIGVIFALLVALAAIYPVAAVWLINRNI